MTDRERQKHPWTERAESRAVDENEDEDEDVDDEDVNKDTDRTRLHFSNHVAKNCCWRGTNQTASLFLSVST